MNVEAYERLRRKRPDLKLPAWNRNMTQEQARFAANMTRGEIIAARTYRLIARDNSGIDPYAFVPAGSDL